jgi:hypothetical protein
MAVRKEMVLSNSTGLRKPRITHLSESEISVVKGKIRRDVEAITTTDSMPYDIEDQLADATNALNALLAICSTAGMNVEIDADSAITKYKNRQLEALTIVTTHTT